MWCCGAENLPVYEVVFEMLNTARSDDYPVLRGQNAMVLAPPTLELSEMLIKLTLSSYRRAISVIVKFDESYRIRWLINVTPQLLRAQDLNLQLRL